MKYAVVVHKRATRYLKTLPDFRKEQIKQSLKQLEDGISERGDIKPMAGKWKG